MTDSESKKEVPGDNSTDQRQDKLLRLLGGKKVGNVNAASDWLHKTRSAVEEDNLKQGLEAQYNASLSLRLSGKARRHVGIGFEQEDTPVGDDVQKKLPDESTVSDKPRPKERDRSRSPTKKREEKSNESGEKNSDDQLSAKRTGPASLDKKSFYMQFTKAKET